MTEEQLEKKRAIWRRHYKNNSAKYMLKSKELTKSIRAFIRWIKEGHTCADCGHSYPYYVMQFDHLDRNTKSGTIDYMVTHYGKQKIYAEMLKCQIVCANCHMIRTHGNIAQLGEQLLCTQ
jgi:hypothetical protein